VDHVAKYAAIKLRVDVGADRTITLPSEVPVGPAQVIILFDKPALPASDASLLGLFANEPEVVDEAMAHVRALRKEWGIGPTK
jgi:hypothetical protein